VWVPEEAGEYWETRISEERRTINRGDAEKNKRRGTPTPGSVRPPADARSTPETPGLGDRLAWRGDLSFFLSFLLRALRVSAVFFFRFPRLLSSEFLSQEGRGPPGPGFPVGFRGLPNRNGGSQRSPGRRRAQGAEDLRRKMINRGDAESAEKKKGRGRPTSDTPGHSLSSSFLLRALRVSAVPFLVFFRIRASSNRSGGKGGPPLPCPGFLRARSRAAPPAGFPVPCLAPAAPRAGNPPREALLIFRSRAKGAEREGKLFPASCRNSPHPE